MTSAEWAAWLQALGGLFTFGAACVAVRAAYQAPKRAAEFAEALRKSTVREDEDRRLKYLVFTNLMQYRAQLVNPAAVASLNVIDVVFREHREVRDAWKHFLQAAAEDPVSGPKIVERYLAIVEKMSRAMGIDADISVADVNSYYYPKSLGEMDEAAWLEMQAKLKRFRPAAARQANPNPPRR